MRALNTQSVGAGSHSTAIPAPTAPSDNPKPGAAEFTSGPSGFSVRCRSSSAAPNAPVIAPVAKPCTTRAASSHPTPSADRNSTIDAASTTNAAASTGRRPTWSDSPPTTSSDTSRASA